MLHTFIVLLGVSLRHGLLVCMGEQCCSHHLPASVGFAIASKVNTASASSLDNEGCSVNAGWRCAATHPLKCSLGEQQPHRQPPLTDRNICTSRHPAGRTTLYLLRHLVTCKILARLTGAASTAPFATSIQLATEPPNVTICFLALSFSETKPQGYPRIRSMSHERCQASSSDSHCRSPTPSHCTVLATVSPRQKYEVYVTVDRYSDISSDILARIKLTHDSTAAGLSL